MRGARDEEERDPPSWRIESADRRQPPDFIIIGTQRGGTTSLYRYLTEHPRIGAAFRKEVHYFDRYFEKGLDWYLAHFPERGEFPIVGEASPFYLFHPEAAARIRAAALDAKFIALLRNPIDRAYSQYHMNVRKQSEAEPFATAVALESERLAESDDPAGIAWRRHSYLRRGLYAEQLQRWFDHFPRDRFCILKSEDFYDDPARQLHEVQAFLGLEPQTPAVFKAFHEAEYPAMEAETRHALRAYFAPHNRELYDLLGVDLGWDRD